MYDQKLYVKLDLKSTSNDMDTGIYFPQLTLESIYIWLDTKYNFKFHFKWIK